MFVALSATNIINFPLRTLRLSGEHLYKERINSLVITKEETCLKVY
jgi:hypothetical protein